MSARHRIVERLAWASVALAAACSAGPVDRGTASPAPPSVASVPAAVSPPPLAIPDVTSAARPTAAIPAAGPDVADAGAPPAADPGVKACAAAIRDGMGDYGRFISNRTPVASSRLLLRIFARACRVRFASLAEAADRASRVGRAERSRILGRAVADVCPGAEAAVVAADLLVTCPTPSSVDGSLPVWRRLDAGTYAFVYALTRAGLRSVWLDELILQASLTPELDR